MEWDTHTTLSITEHNRQLCLYHCRLYSITDSNILKNHHGLVFRIGSDIPSSPHVSTYNWHRCMYITTGWVIEPTLIY